MSRTDLPDAIAECDSRHRPGPAQPAHPRQWRRSPIKNRGHFESAIFLSTGGKARSPPRVRSTLEGEISEHAARLRAKVAVRRQRGVNPDARALPEQEQTPVAMLVILIIGFIAGPGRVLVRISDRVAGHRRLVGVGALAAISTVFDVLSGHYPSALPPEVIESGDVQAGQRLPPSAWRPAHSSACVLPAIRLAITNRTRGENTGSMEGITISRIAALVRRSTALA